MIREIFILLYVVIAFLVVSWLTDSPSWAAMIAALIAGMWADLRIQR